jgi:transcription initiation factor TFIID/TFIIF subunit
LSIAVRKPPFKIEEDGWGEFELEMVLTDVSGKDHAITHDLNFHNNRYEVKQVITFKNPKAPLLGALRGSGPVPGDTAADAGTNGAGRSKKRQSGANETQKRKKPDTKGIDMDKLAEGLQKLGEDDLLQVVQMVHDNKSEESWMRNDVDRKFSQHACEDLESSASFGGPATPCDFISSKSANP